MAGEWIKWEKGLLHKPEVAQIASALGIGTHEAAARLMAVWEWADVTTETGIIHGVSGGHIDHIAGLKGFAEVMASTVPSPWLIIEGNKIQFTNYQRHNGKCAKKRAISNRRQADLRERNKLASPPRAPAPVREEG